MSKQTNGLKVDLEKIDYLNYTIDEIHSKYSKVEVGEYVENIKKMGLPERTKEIVNNICIKMGDNVKHKKNLGLGNLPDETSNKEINIEENIPNFLNMEMSDSPAKQMFESVYLNTLKFFEIPKLIYDVTEIIHLENNELPNFFECTRMFEELGIEPNTTSAINLAGAKESNLSVGSAMEQKEKKIYGHKFVIKLKACDDMKKFVRCIRLNKKTGKIFARNPENNKFEYIEMFSTDYKNKPETVETVYNNLYKLIYDYLTNNTNDTNTKNHLINSALYYYIVSCAKMSVNKEVCEDSHLFFGFEI